MKIDRIIAITTTTAALILGASMLRPDRALAIPSPMPLPVSTTPLPLNPDDPAATRPGSADNTRPGSADNTRPGSADNTRPGSADNKGANLVFKGALHLRSTNPRFGGISGLRHAGGERFIGVTDTGNWIVFSTVEQGDRLTAIAGVVLTPILQSDGEPAGTKADGDAEALEFDPATGAATVTYEQDHRLAHFTGIDPARPETLMHRPARVEHMTAMMGWPANGGGEAMAALHGGKAMAALHGGKAMATLPADTRIVIAEDAMHRDGTHAALVTRAGVTRAIGIPGVPGHSPTDAVALDATHFLVLHRRFTLAMGIGAAITLVDLDNPATARLVARWQPPFTLDNMEGMAIRRVGSRTFLYLVSDDNLNSIQRTILMKFELVSAVARRSPPRRQSTPALP